MVPAMMKELLFDDILFGDRAREEHARFRRVLEWLGIEIVESLDLLEETLGIDEARRWIFDVLLEDLPRNRREQLERRPAAEIAEILIGGIRSEVVQGAVEVEDLYLVAPIPNWCFQRDPQVVIGEGIVFSAMAAPARHREAMLARAMFRFHPKLAAVPTILDPLELDRDSSLFVGKHRPTLEGGDVLVLSRDAVMVGHSERTNRTGIQQLARALQQREEGPRWLFVVELPQRRAYMHLDTLFTPVDRNACLVYPPVILPGGSEQAHIYEIDLQADELSMQPREDLLKTLARRGIEYEPIPCGGTDPVTQQREQWTDGANALVLTPGVITLYDRNQATAEELNQRGFRIVEAEDLLLGRDEVDLDEEGRVCILISSHEISRARGGPHCLTHPLRRDDLP
ncbi:MAG: hypothetical protein IT349_15115 [Candidatus Eisenbacteria bacterium]|nr:hypothetical protein [Candidatus Eisenbacteria bacterium]MCC7143426.1 hypothetical protein [Candidatus Eisenbacteria bacterium]